MSKQHTTVKPVRLREHSPTLNVDVSRVVGYRCVFEDGTTGPTRRTVALALLDKRAPRETTSAA